MHSIQESVMQRPLTAGPTNLETIYKVEVDHWARFHIGGDLPAFS